MITLDTYANEVHEANQKWWHDLKTGERLNRNTGELLMLVTSELAEALEGDRKNLMDDKLSQYKMFDVEIVDAMIRLFDIAKGKEIKLEEIFRAKMRYNANRYDHSKEGRLQNEGKKY